MLGQKWSVVIVGGLAFAAALFAGRPAAAADYTYAFTGQVTAVDNPFGYLSTAAAVGAPVSGSFTYTDTPDNAPFELNPAFTNYLNGGTGEPQATGIVVRVGAAEAGSGPTSLTNMVVGDNNAADSFPPFFPVGDSFRHQDTLEPDSPLFDFAAAQAPQFPSAAVFLVDPTGTALASQALPGGLPLPGLADRTGLIFIDNDNFESTGRVSFRIDSIQLVPEPAALTLLAAGVGLILRRRRRQ